MIPADNPAVKELKEDSTKLRKELLGSFDGAIPRQALPFYYRATVVVLALMMVFLPLCYLAIIGATSWMVFHLWVHVGKPVGLAGGSLLSLILIFMLKPFFVRRCREHDPRVLFPKAEPVLFEFVAKICQSVQAPTPREIHVTCEVNAAAGFRGGVFSFLSRDMVLVIGLPLAGGLSVRAFAGILAHEFGHFAQRTSMRLTYVIRMINSWFARAVHERDLWDVWLYKGSKNSFFLIAYFFYVARLLVFLVRGILWVLMTIGHMLSCYMSRQMEFDADRYSTYLSGSQTFIDTSRQLPIMGLSSQSMYANLQFFYEEGRLADDIPALILGTQDQLPKETLEEIKKLATEAKTGLFDTHPSDMERNARARSQNEKGLFKDPPKRILQPVIAVAREEVVAVRNTAAPAPGGALASGALDSPPAPFSRAARTRSTDPFGFDARAAERKETTVGMSGSPRSTDPFGFHPVPRKDPSGDSKTRVVIPRVPRTGRKEKEGDLVKESPESALYVPDFPASVLFRDFGTICKTVSNDYYRSVLGNRFDPKLLCSVESFLKEQEFEHKSSKSLGRFFQGQLSFLRPLQVSLLSFNDLPELQQAREVIRQARDGIMKTVIPYKGALEKVVLADDLLIQARQAEILLQAGFQYKGKQFIPSLPGAEQEYLEVSSKNILLEPFETAVSKRLVAALQLILIPEVAAQIKQAHEMRKVVERFVPILVKVRDFLPALLEVRGAFQELSALCAVLEGQEINDDRFYNVLEQRTQGLVRKACELQERLERVDYPFEHGRGNINLRQYALKSVPSGIEELGSLMQVTAEALDKLFPLSFRVLSRLTFIAEQLEETIGFDPLPDPSRETQEDTC